MGTLVHHLKNDHLIQQCYSKGFNTTMISYILIQQ